MLESEETGALKSFRNIDRVEVAEASAVGVADLIGAASIVISEKALEVLGSRAGEPAKAKQAPKRAAASSKSSDEKDGE